MPRKASALEPLQKQQPHQQQLQVPHVRQGGCLLRMKMHWEGESVLLYMCCHAPLPVLLTYRSIAELGDKQYPVSQVHMPGQSA